MASEGPICFGGPTVIAHDDPTDPTPVGGGYMTAPCPSPLIMPSGLPLFFVEMCLMIWEVFLGPDLHRPLNTAIKGHSLGGA